MRRTQTFDDILGEQLSCKAFLTLGFIVDYPKVRLHLMLEEVVPIEHYALKRKDGHWRIDRQVMEKDRVIGQTI